MKPQSVTPCGVSFIHSLDANMVSTIHPNQMIEHPPSSQRRDKSALLIYSMLVLGPASCIYAVGQGKPFSDRLLSLYLTML
jgi:hypothetical protein